MINPKIEAVYYLSKVTNNLALLHGQKFRWMLDNTNKTITLFPSIAPIKSNLVSLQDYRVISKPKPEYAI
jgi:hypothetical protein